MWTEAKAIILFAIRTIPEPLQNTDMEATVVFPTGGNSLTEFIYC